MDFTLINDHPRAVQEMARLGRVERVDEMEYGCGENEWFEDDEDNDEDDEDDDDLYNEYDEQDDDDQYEEDNYEDEDEDKDVLEEQFRCLATKFGDLDGKVNNVLREQINTQANLRAQHDHLKNMLHDAWFLLRKLHAYGDATIATIAEDPSA